MVEEKQRELRVVVFPWLAHGHITPFVELGKRLTSHGLKVFIVSTPMNIKLRITPQVWDSPGIDLIELPMPSVEGLPTGVECSAELVKRPEGKVKLPLLTVAMDLLEKPFEALLQKLSPDFVIFDVMQYWVPRVAAKQPNPIAPILFVPPGVTSFCYIEGELIMASGNPIPENMTASPNGFPSSNIHFTLFDARKAMELLYCKHPGGLSVAERSSICLRESWAVVCNTCLELEGVYIEYLQSLVKRPVYPVGILMRKLPPLPVDDICLQWLDKQPAASVVVLSFGSEYNLTNEQFTPIAMGLQESNVSFLWFLPAGNDLVQGFQDQIGDKGLLMTKWAPQLNILNHASTGAFLTHCGWNSMTEGLRFGLPLITLPMQFEQGLNAKLA
ncbi:cyanidin-3-O-glucoside 2-O-glucuronosyltransferase-like [Cryptomeria japonica]|uniref:cyanidin-3-O-glucoside 2-O-glucuronosyltransferase-like n=1 Tax=Cryptomeria japonica TaxID=3369 RepID=UPI0027DA303D|nr:cyanidin-3-O-glucoside 2-O-glucuronosyltransferase-like [Cryptomeria japonica]